MDSRATLMRRTSPEAHLLLHSVTHQFHVLDLAGALTGVLVGALAAGPPCRVVVSGGRQLESGGAFSGSNLFHPLFHQWTEHQQ